MTVYWRPSSPLGVTELATRGLGHYTRWDDRTGTKVAMDVIVLPLWFMQAAALCGSKTIGSVYCVALVQEACQGA